MSSNGTHERHVTTCDWVKIHGIWIRDKGNPKVVNKDWPCGNERTSPLNPIFSQQGWGGGGGGGRGGGRERGKKKRVFR